MNEYIGIIRAFAGTFAPKGWAFCEGQLIPIAQNTALFTILGTRYGGDGVYTFALPDLRGRVPIGAGRGLGQTDRTLGEQGGAESATISVSELPKHTHAANAVSANATRNSPVNNLWADESENVTAMYTDLPPDTHMNVDAVTTAFENGGQPHENRQPYIVLMYIICMEGRFPVRA